MTQPSKAFWEPISILALLLLILLVSICHLQGGLKRGKSGEAQPVPERTSKRETSSKPRKRPSAELATPSATDAESEVGQPSAVSTPIPTPTPEAKGGEKTRVLTEEETIEHQPAYRQTLETADGAIQINLNGLGPGQVEMNDRRSEIAPPSPASSEDSSHSFMPRRRGGDDSDSSDSDPGPSPGGNPPAQGRPPSPHPCAEVNAVETVPPLQSAAPGKPTFPFSGATVAETFQNLERDGRYGLGEGQRVRRMDSISLSPVAFRDPDNGNTHAEVNRLNLDDDPLDPDMILAELTRSRSFDTLSPIAARSGKSGTGRFASMIDDLKAEAGRDVFMELINPKNAEKAKAKREKVRQNKDKAPANSQDDTVEAANTRPKATEVVYNSEESASSADEAVVITKDSRDTPSETMKEEATQGKRRGTESSPTKEGKKKDKKDKKDKKQKEAAKGKRVPLPDELTTDIKKKSDRKLDAFRTAEDKKEREAKEAARQEEEKDAGTKADTARSDSELSVSSEDGTASRSSGDGSASKGKAKGSKKKSGSKESQSGANKKKDATSKSDAKAQKEKKKTQGDDEIDSSESDSATGASRESDSDATRKKRAATRRTKRKKRASNAEAQSASDEEEKGRGRSTSRRRRDRDRQSASDDGSRRKKQGEDQASETEEDDRVQGRGPHRSSRSRQRPQAPRRTRARQPARQGDDDPEDQYDEEEPPAQQTSRAPPPRRTRQTTQGAHGEQEITPEFERPAATRPGRERVLRNAPLLSDYDSEVRENLVSGRDPAYDPSPAEEEAVRRNRWARKTGNKVDPQDAAVESRLRKRQRSLQERASKARAKYGQSIDPNEAKSDPENEEVDKDPALKVEEDEESGQTAEQEKRAARAARAARDRKGKGHERGHGKDAEQRSTTEVAPEDNGKTEKENTQSETKEASKVAAEPKTEDVSEADDLETHVGEVMRREAKTEIRRNRALANVTGSRPRLAETTGPTDPVPLQINALDTTTTPAAVSDTPEAVVVEAANIGTESHASVPETRTQDISEDSSEVTVTAGSEPMRHEVPDPIADGLPPPEYTPGDNPDASFHDYVDRTEQGEAAVATSAFRAGGSNGRGGGGSGGGSGGGAGGGGSDSSRPSGSGGDSPGNVADGSSGRPGDRPSDMSSDHPSRRLRESQPSTPADSVPVPGVADVMRAMDMRNRRRNDAAFIAGRDTGHGRDSQSEHSDRDGMPVAVGGDSDYDGRTGRAEPASQDSDRNAGAKLEHHPETPEEKVKRLKERQDGNLAVEATWSFDALDDPKHHGQERTKAASESPVRSRNTNFPPVPRDPEIDTSEKDQEVRAKAKAAWIEKDKEYRKARQERVREQAASAAQVIPEKPVETSAAAPEANSQTVESQENGSSESQSVDRREDVGDSPSGKSERRPSISKPRSTIDVEQPGIDKEDAETSPEVAKQLKGKLAERYYQNGARAESSSRTDSPSSRSDVETAPPMQSAAGVEKARAETERSEAQHAEGRALDTTQEQTRQGKTTSNEESGDAPQHPRKQKGQDAETLTPAEAVRRAFAKREAEKEAEKSPKVAKRPDSAGVNQESGAKAESNTDSDAKPKHGDKNRRESAVDLPGKDGTPERQADRQGDQNRDLEKQKTSKAETPEGSKQDSADSKEKSKDLKNNEGEKKERKRHQAYAADPEDEDAAPNEVVSLGRRERQEETSPRRMSAK